MTRIIFLVLLFSLTRSAPAQGTRPSQLTSPPPYASAAALARFRDVLLKGVGAADVYLRYTEEQVSLGRLAARYKVAAEVFLKEWRADLDLFDNNRLPRLSETTSQEAASRRQSYLEALRSWADDAQKAFDTVQMEYRAGVGTRNKMAAAQFRLLELQSQLTSLEAGIVLPVH